MTSFPATARRVRDESLGPQRRRMHLRNCLYHFAPYGFRATWHHLALTHRIPERVPARPHPWDSWGCHAIAYCPDPCRHPAEHLPVVVARVLDACAAGTDPAGRCRVCGDRDRHPQSACRTCGVLPAT